MRAGSGRRSVEKALQRVVLDLQALPIPALAVDLERKGADLARELVDHGRDRRLGLVEDLVGDRLPARKLDAARSGTFGERHAILTAQHAPERVEERHLEDLHEGFGVGGAGVEAPPGEGHCDKRGDVDA